MPQSRNALNLRGFKLLLLALLTAAAALAALTLSTTAQTPGGESNSDSTETAQGRIIARIHDTTGEDGVDNYRVEFGFFPEWAMNEADSWSDAIAPRSSWLPSSRYLTKSTIDARAAADNRAWLRSSLSSVPAQSPQSPGGDSAQITGRVIARYNPDSEGRLRVEFGFVPEWAFTDTSTTEQAVERLGASNLPSARYLRVATIDASRGVWLRSSAIDVPFRAPVVVIETVQPPVIDSISCTPASPTVDESVTCAATLSGGDPDSYAWSGGASTGSEAEYTTSFSSSGSKTVSLTATNTAGSDTGSTTLTVVDPLQPPAIDSLNCTPSSPTVDESITCTANLSGDAPDSYAWSGGGGSGDSESHTTSFSKAGDYTISLTVINAAGSDSDSTALTVYDELQPPVIDAINCTPELPIVNHGVYCTPSLSGGAPDTYDWGYGVGPVPWQPTLSISFGKLGEQSVSLTVANAAGSDTHSITITVGGRLAPVIDGISCSPASPTVDDPVECTASLSGGEPVSWAWSGGAESGGSAAYSTSFSSAGGKTVSLTVANAAGSDTDSVTVTIGGRLAPVIDGINCSPASPTVDDPVECTASLSGGDPVSWSWSGGDESSSSAAYSTSFSSAGGKTVSLTVTNAAGSATDSISLTAFDGVQAPVIDSVSCSPSSPSAPVVNETVTCTTTLSGGAPASYSWSGGASTGAGATYTTSFSAAGEVTVSLAVTNAAGSDTGSFALTVVAALQAPVVDSITCTPSDPPVGDPVKCTASLSGGTPSSYAWSGGRAASAAAIYNTDFGEAGEATVSLTVTNAAGSGNGTTTVTANGYPQCSWNGTRQFSVGESWSGDAEAFGAGIVTCTDADTLTYTLSSSDSAILGVSESDGTWTVEALAAGTAYVHVTVTDPGDLSYTVDLYVTVVAAVLAPVIDSISCTPSSPEVNESVTCTATLSGGDPDSYSWSGGASSDSSSTYSTSFGSDGSKTVSKTVSLTVTNSAGSDTESTTVTVEASEAAVQAPVIDSIDCTPFSPTVGQSMTCTANLSGGTPDSYSWSGGSSTGAGATFTTSFSSPNPQTVVLRVSNAAGTAIQEFPVHVEGQ